MEGKPSNEWILENLDAIQNMSVKRPRTEVSAISLMRPAKLYDNRLCRKRNKMTESDLRKCINCNEILLNNEHSCKNCAVVQEVDWLEMPTLNEMKYKLMTHSLPCAYKRINHFNVRRVLYVQVRSCVSYHST